MSSLFITFDSNTALGPLSTNAISVPKVFPTYAEAQLRHPFCKAWSCAFLNDPERIFFKSDRYDPYVFSIRCSTCILCNKSFTRDTVTDTKRLHQELYLLSSCNKAVYLDFEPFCEHLKTHRGVGRLLQWQKFQFEYWTMAPGLRSAQNVINRYTNQWRLLYY